MLQYLNIFVLNVYLFRTPICRSVASRGINGNPEVVNALNNNASFFVTAGDRKYIK